MESTNQTQDKKIEDIHRKIEHRVSWTIFVWAVGLITIIGGVVFSYSLQANNKADNAVNQVAEIKGDIKSINTSLIFINSSLKELKDDIGKRGY